MTVIHIDGASGYAAGEVARLVAAHPEFVLGVLASASHPGVPLGDVFPSLQPLGATLATRTALDAAVREGDAVVFAGEAADAGGRVESHLSKGARVVDLSAAFRLRDLGAHRAWYGEPRLQRLNAVAAYGLTELHASAIAAAQLVANPGCYPTAALLALAPLIRSCDGRITNIVIDAKSGVSGAGRTPKPESLYCEVHDGIRPYGVRGHRHAPEIREQLAEIGCRAPFAFLPHVVPLSRGMLASCYVRFAGSAPPDGALEAAYRAAYDRSPLVDVLPLGTLPETRAVARTARAAVGLSRLADDLVVAACAIDNLGKGAAAQAVQNLNVMYGRKEDLGLDAVAAVA
jgi:N-acetyl-gamma-glutamyl-phosphate reductase